MRILWMNASMNDSGMSSATTTVKLHGSQEWPASRMEIY
jgi:hypothetical protein